MLPPPPSLKCNPLLTCYTPHPQTCFPLYTATVAAKYHDICGQISHKSFFFVVAVFGMRYDKRFSEPIAEEPMCLENNDFAWQDQWVRHQVLFAANKHLYVFFVFFFPSEYTPFSIIGIAKFRVKLVVLCLVHEFAVRICLKLACHGPFDPLREPVVYKAPHPFRAVRHRFQTLARNTTRECTAPTEKPLLTCATNPCVPPYTSQRRNQVCFVHLG